MVHITGVPAVTEAALGITVTVSPLGIVIVAVAPRQASYTCDDPAKTPNGQWVLPRDVWSTDLPAAK